MAHRYSGPDFAVSVEGDFVSERLWLVHAVVEHRGDNRGETPPRLGPAVRLVLMRGIQRESQRGWDRRAEHVRVLVEGAPELDGLFDVPNPSVPHLSVA